MPFVCNFHILTLGNTQLTKKILVVEDNQVVIDMMQKIIVHLGYDFIAATTGKQGVNMATSQLPDLILLDISLPEMDGFAVARQIRQNPKTQTIPILAATGRAFFEDQEACLQNGCDDYISKPFTPKQLASRIKKLLM